MKVYLTRRVANMTDGMGPMQIDKCFLYEGHANKYINAQPGIMGRRACWSKREVGDWDVIPLEVIEEDIIGNTRSANEIKIEDLEDWTTQIWKEYAAELYQGKCLILSVSLGRGEYQVTLGKEVLYRGSDKSKAKYAYEEVTKLDD